MNNDKICAVITAAGKSSRMGAFKPMLEIGGISASRRIIMTLAESGVKNIAVVTGNNKDALIKHLKGYGTVYLQNSAYAETDMFYSAKIGIKYFIEDFDKLLFTPVDVPLFSANTVKALLDSEKELAIPVCDSKKGHPVMIGAKAAPYILSYGGENGLKGAIHNTGFSIDYVNVDDAGILFDMDTPDDYRKLVDLYEGYKSVK